MYPYIYAYVNIHTYISLHIFLSFKNSKRKMCTEQIHAYNVYRQSKPLSFLSPVAKYEDTLAQIRTEQMQA